MEGNEGVDMLVVVVVCSRNLPKRRSEGAEVQSTGKPHEFWQAQGQGTELLGYQTPGGAILPRPEYSIAPRGSG